MTTQRTGQIARILKPVAGAVAALGLLTLGVGSAQASVAYGSINNFDTVNDTGVECHGFEIELEDIHSADITYTFSWNHYGTPKITEDNSNPLHPKVRVRYESAKKPDGTWAAYTAIPSAPIPPTQGHQFTDPTVNFGGEHFGAGYRGTPTSISYHWLIDSGGVLTLGPAVNIATPTFTYNPPAATAPPGNNSTTPSSNSAAHPSPWSAEPCSAPRTKAHYFKAENKRSGPFWKVGIQANQHNST